MFLVRSFSSGQAASLGPSIVSFGQKFEPKEPNIDPELSKFRSLKNLRLIIKIHVTID